MGSLHRDCVVGASGGRVKVPFHASLIKIAYDSTSLADVFVRQACSRQGAKEGKQSGDRISTPTTTASSGYSGYSGYRWRATSDGRADRGGGGGAQASLA